MSYWVNTTDVVVEAIDSRCPYQFQISDGIPGPEGRFTRELEQGFTGSYSVVISVSGPEVGRDLDVHAPRHGAGSSPVV